MENTTIDQQNASDQVYAFAANMMLQQDKNTYETKMALIEQGLDEESASVVVNNLEQEIEKAKKEKANKDMLYGGLWLAGGLVVTIVSISTGSRGIIAYGAIIFGAIQFIKGMMNAIK
jgi:hypothetical protein